MTGERLQLVDPKANIDGSNVRYADFVLGSRQFGPLSN
jgi:hypothetical protein